MAQPRAECPSGKNLVLASLTASADVQEEGRLRTANLILSSVDLAHAVSPRAVGAAPQKQEARAVTVIRESLDKGLGVRPQMPALLVHWHHIRLPRVVFVERPMGHRVVTPSGEHSETLTPESPNHCKKF